MHEKVHQGLNKTPTYQKRNGIDTCSYCGSISPEEATKILSDPKSSGTGTDWTGWPDKFYLSIPRDLHRDVYKFYGNHLYDAQEELFDLIYDKLGIQFIITKGRLNFSAPFSGYQTQYGDAFDYRTTKVS